MSEKDSKRRMFSIENLKVTPPRTPEDVQRAIVQERFAEMTPRLAGEENIGSSSYITEPEEVVHHPNDAVMKSSPIIVQPRPIVFLDMDDVLCLSDQFGSREMLKIIEQEIPDRAELWAGLVDAAAAVNLYELHSEFMPLYVISSSWATYLDQDQMCYALTRIKLQFVVDNLHAEWRTPRALSSSRLDEIEWWLYAHRKPEQPFLVIDDTYSGTGLAHSPLAHNGHVVLCRSCYGFTKKRLKEARYQLQRQLKDQNLSP